MTKIKCDINQQDLKRVDLHFVKSEEFSLTWSCGSRQRDTTSSEWKFRLNILAVKGLMVAQRHVTLCQPQPLKVRNVLYKPRDKRGFFNSKCELFCELFSFNLNTYGSTLDVYRREIPTSEVDPRSERVNPATLCVFFSWFILIYRSPLSYVLEFFGLC